jgi:PAS domain S-box-containing protein
VSNAETKADVAGGDHEDVPSLLIGRQTGHFINWKRTGHTALLREAGYFLLGLVSLATVTGLYFWLDAPLVAAAFTYLIVLVLLSLVSNLSFLIALSLIGVCCLSYFFASPIYSFRVDYAQDLITISAFVITAFVVNFLVTRVRGEQRDHTRTCETLRDANQRLEVTNRTLRIENEGRKRAEQALRESEDKLRQIMDTVPGLTWSTGSDGSDGKKGEVQPRFAAQVQAILNVLPTYTWYSAPSGGLAFVNNRTAEYLGVPKDHPLRFGIDIGAKWDDWVPLLHPDDQEEARKYWFNLLRTGEGGEQSYRVRSAQGDYRWFNTRIEPLRASDGTLLLWMGATLDIEELMRAQEALRESERSARSAIDGIAGLLAIMAPNGEVETVNRQCLEYFGQSLEWLANWGTNDAVHPEDLPRVIELFSRAIASGIPYHFDQRLRRFDGEYRWFENRGVPIRDGSGRIARWYVLLTDIEDRKRAEGALRSALDGIAGLLAILAANGEIETVNCEVFEYFGRPLEWIKNWGTNDAVHPQDLPRVLELVGRGIASGVPFNFELRLRRFDGKYRRFENRHVAIRDDSGRIACWYVLMTDIEDRTQALARLDQMQSDFAHMNRVSMMGELAASLSHEITQPIASARNNARAAQNFIDMQPPDLGEVREALDCVVGDTDRAGDIIDRIRDHIKKTPPRKEHFDLNEAINEVIVLGRSAIIKNGVWVQTRLSEGLCPVHCDRVQLQQVVLNLILNAAEAMGSVEAAPRELLISTEQHHADVLVAVRDSGPGIDPAHLERVFEAFYTTKSGGVGMGLSICRSIIDAHGGRLWVEANEPRGTIFQFTLPSAEAKSSIVRPFTTATDPLE